MNAETVRLLVAARRSGALIEALPQSAKPADLAQAHAIQDATASALGDAIAGWKVSVNERGEVMRGVILQSRVFPTGARIPARLVPLLGIEAEIAFRFDRDLPPRADEYAPEDVAAACTAVAAIEVVDSRFRNYKETPLLDRTADCMSNGALVVGTAREDWRGIDLAQLEATLAINGRVAVQKRAGHPAGDPIRPAIPLANALRQTTGVRAGQIITTGTYTGLIFAEPGDAISVEFAGFGSVSVTFERT